MLTDPIQIGSGTEVMYLAAKSLQERDGWMEALRTGKIVPQSSIIARYVNDWHAGR